MKLSDKGIMSVAGTIRGSIAFGLAVSISIDNKFHKAIIMSSTLGLVMITTLVFGAIMPMVISFFKSFDKNTENKEKLITKEVIQVITSFEEGNVHENEDLKSQKAFEFLHPNFQEK